MNLDKLSARGALTIVIVLTVATFAVAGIIEKIM